MYSWRSIRHGGTKKRDWSLCSRMHICGAAGTMAILLHRNKGTGGLSIRGTDAAGNPSGDQRSSTTGRRCAHRVQLGDDPVVVRRAGAELGHVNRIERGLRPDTKQTTRQKMPHSFAKARASVVTRNPRAAVADPTSRHDGTEHARSVGGGCASDAQLFHAVAPGLDLAADACDRPALSAALRPAARNVDRRARPPIPVHTGRPACRPAWARPGFRRGRFVHSCARAPLPPGDNHSCGCPGADAAQF